MIIALEGLKMFRIIIHGGAGRWSGDKERIIGAKESIKEALEESIKILEDGGDAGDAVVKALVVMEDSGFFNAGSGSVLNIEGIREMDAAYADSEGNIGAVASVRYPKNPILLARYVAENTDHLLLAGEGADVLASKLDLEMIEDPPKRIIRRYNELIEDYKGLNRFPKNLEIVKDFYGDTIGAIALDEKGKLAVGVSTGGLWLKLPGRVGDTPIYGGGFYISRYFAACATGIGEVIMKGLLSYKAYTEYLDSGDVYRAVLVAIDEANKIMSESAGLIALDKYGRLAYKFNSRNMMIAYFDGEDRFVSLESNE